MARLDQTKITTVHLKREAAIYVRQSTPLQVEKHTASTQLQYDLRDRAMEFGWGQDSVRVYDGDLGASGSRPGKRQGFAELVRDVGLGRIGIVVAFDATRLARNNSDWHRLLPESVRLQTAAKAPAGWVAIGKAATALGVSRRTVLHWVQSGQLEAVLAGTGRRRGLRINVRKKLKRKHGPLFDT